MYRSGTSHPLATFGRLHVRPGARILSAGYIDGEPTTERLLETLERFEEDTTDTSRVHRPMNCRMDIGEALPVTTERPRGEADPLTVQLEERLKTMLAETAPLCHAWKD